MSAFCMQQIDFPRLPRCVPGSSPMISERPLFSKTLNPPSIQFGSIKPTSQIFGCDLPLTVIFRKCPYLLNSEFQISGWSIGTWLLFQVFNAFNRVFTRFHFVGFNTEPTGGATLISAIFTIIH